MQMPRRLRRRFFVIVEHAKLHTRLAIKVEVKVKVEVDEPGNRCPACAWQPPRSQKSSEKPSPDDVGSGGYIKAVKARVACG